MTTWRAILYIFAVALVVLAALNIPSNRISLGLMGAACALLAFSLPVIVAGT